MCPNFRFPSSRTRTSTCPTSARPTCTSPAGSLASFTSPSSRKIWPKPSYVLVPLEFIILHCRVVRLVAKKCDLLLKSLSKFIFNLCHSETKTLEMSCDMTFDIFITGITHIISRLRLFKLSQICCALFHHSSHLTIKLEAWRAICKL